MGGVNCPDDVGRTRGAASPCNVIVAYADGSVIRHGAPRSSCGWAVKLTYNGRSIIKSGGQIGKTSNQMEITAVIEAMKAINNKDIPAVIFTDSKYVYGIMNHRLIARQNKGLWSIALDEMKKFKYLRIEWVRGHNGVDGNEEVDRISRDEAIKQRERQKAWQKQNK